MYLLNWYTLLFLFFLAQWDLHCQVSVEDCSSVHFRQLRNQFLTVRFKGEIFEISDNGMLDSLRRDSLNTTVLEMSTKSKSVCGDTTLYYTVQEFNDGFLSIYFWFDSRYRFGICYEEIRGSYTISYPHSIVHVYNVSKKGLFVIDRLQAPILPHKPSRSIYIIKY